MLGSEILIDIKLSQLYDPQKRLSQYETTECILCLLNSRQACWIRNSGMSNQLITDSISELQSNIAESVIAFYVVDPKLLHYQVKGKRANHNSFSVLVQKFAVAKLKT